jgi:hypothetical protein
LAGAIRDAVNSNPILAPVIQFNNLKRPTHAGLEQFTTYGRISGSPSKILLGAKNRDGAFNLPRFLSSLEDVIWHRLTVHALVRKIESLRLLVFRNKPVAIGGFYRC